MVSIMEHFEKQPHKNNLETHPPTSQDLVGHRIQHIQGRASGAAGKQHQDWGPPGGVLRAWQN